jgi:hypothetical protein
MQRYLQKTLSIVLPLGRERQKLGNGVLKQLGLGGEKAESAAKNTTPSCVYVFHEAFMQSGKSSVAPDIVSQLL